MSCAIDISEKLELTPRTAQQQYDVSPAYPLSEAAGDLVFLSFYPITPLALVLLMLGYTLAANRMFFMQATQLCRLNKPLLATAFSRAGLGSNNEIVLNLEKIRIRKNGYRKKPRVYYRSILVKVVIALWVL